MTNLRDFFYRNRTLVSIIKYAIMAILMLLAFKWTAFVEVLLIVAIFFACTEFDFDGFYVPIFLVNFRFVFRHNLVGAIPYVEIVFFSYAIFALIKYFLIKKEKLKLNWWIVGVSAGYIAYLLLLMPITGVNFAEFARHFVMIGIINVAILFREKIDIRKLLLVFVIGVLSAAGIEMVTQFWLPEQFATMDMAVHAYFHWRHRGLAGDPNYYSLDLLLSIAAVFYMFVKNKIKAVSFCIYEFLLFLMAYLTYSKSLIVGLCIFAICAILFTSTYGMRKYWKRVVALMLVACTGVVFIKVVLQQNPFITISRFSQEYIVDSGNTSDSGATASDSSGGLGSADAVVPSATPNDHGGSSQGLDNFTTGRWTLWKNHLKEVVSSSKNFIFGIGLGKWAEPMEAHNTYVQSLYEIGFVGTLLLLTLLFLVLKHIGVRMELFKPKNWLYWLPFVCGVIMFANVNYLAVTSFAYHWIVMLVVLSEGVKSVAERKKFGQKIDIKNSPEENAQDKPLLTIFTPTYNRAHTLGRLYESLCNQTSKKFVWLLVDDGSTDDTKDIIAKWQKEKKVTIKYIYQKNAGKMQAHNTGVENTETALFLCLDSDDYISTTAVAEILVEYDNIRDDSDICGLLAYKGYSVTETIGEQMPFMDYASLEEAYRNGLSGDTTLVFKTDVIREYKFPRFNDEKFVPEAYVYTQIDQKYRYKLIHRIWTICEYMSDGYSKNKINNFNKNAYGMSEYYNLRVKYAGFDCINKSKWTVGYICYSIISNRKDPFKTASDKLLYICLYPIGWMLAKKRRKIISER